MAAPESDMQLEDDAEDKVEFDVAAAMGFGSFGSKPHLAKRRKTNATDNTGSGSNSEPLGMRPVKEAIMETAKLPSTQPELNTIVSLNYSAEPQDPARPLETKAVSQEDDTQTPLYQHPGTGSHSQASRNSAGKLPNGEWDWQALRRGVRDEQGDIAYYDASFVEDPWAALDNKR